MNRKKDKFIGLDIDCVLADTIELFVPMLNKWFNQNKKLEEIIYYEFEKCYNVTGEEILDFFKYFTKNNFWKDIKPLPEAKKVFDSLSEIYNIVVVTSRPKEHLYNTTIDWLKKYEFDYYDLIFVDDNDKYKPLLDKNYNTEFFIEDCYGFASVIADYGVTVYLLDYPWNRLADKNKIIRLKKLSDILTQH